MTAPVDWRDMKAELKRDWKARTISVQYTGTMTFAGQCYDHLSALYASDGHCLSVPVLITDTCGGVTTMVASGIFILSDCEWDLSRCTVKCSLVDDGIGATIENNRTIPVSPISTRSKNAAPITPATPIEMGISDVYSGSVGPLRTVFDWFDGLRQCLDYITDGTTALISAWYASLPDGEHISFTSGAYFRGIQTARISYTFDDIWLNVAKLYNLWMFATEDTNGARLLRIEPEAYFFAGAQDIEATSLNGLVRTIDTDRLYATITVGSKEAIMELGSDNPLPFIDLYGFVKSTYHATGICNSSSDLDLSTDWITDANILNRIGTNVYSDSAEWDGDMVLVQYDANAVQFANSPYLNYGAAPYLYNEQMLNIHVLERYSLPCPFGVNFGATFNDSFRAEQSTVMNAFYVPAGDMPSGHTAAQPVMFDDDFTAPNNDVGNAWGGGTAQGTPVDLAHSRFTATAQGLYVFVVGANWGISSTRPHIIANTWPTYVSLYPGIRVGFIVELRNSSDVLLTTLTQVGGVTGFVVGNYAEDMTFSVSMSAGDYITVKGFMDNHTLLPNTVLGAPFGPSAGVGSAEQSVCHLLFPTIATSKVVNGGVIYPSSGAAVEVYSFDRAIPSSDWSSITDHPEQGVTINGQRVVHIDSVTRNLATGATSWKMIKKP